MITAANSTTEVYLQQNAIIDIEIMNTRIILYFFYGNVLAFEGICGSIILRGDKYAQNVSG